MQRSEAADTSVRSGYYKKSLIKSLSKSLSQKSLREKPAEEPTVCMLLVVGCPRFSRASSLLSEGPRQAGRHACRQADRQKKRSVSCWLKARSIVAHSASESPAKPLRFLALPLRLVKLELVRESDGVLQVHKAVPPSSRYIR